MTRSFLFLLGALFSLASLGLGQEEKKPFWQPDYYYVDGGFLIHNEKAAQPGPKAGQIQKEELTEPTLYGEMAAGHLFHYLSLKGSAGYVYRNAFLNNPERVTRFFREGRFLDFPLHPRFSKRTHRLQLDVSYGIANIDMGFYGYYEAEKIGSNLVSGNKTSQQKSLLLKEGFYFRPFGAISYDRYKTMLTLHLKKEVNALSRDLSYKSYLRGIKNPSYTLSHHIFYPKLSSELEFRYYDLKSHFADIYKDYNRYGFMFLAQKSWQEFTFLALFTSYKDVYQQKTAGPLECRYENAPLEGADLCQRKDEASMYRFGVTYSPSSEVLYGAYFSGIENRNSRFPIYDHTKNSFLLSYTYQFNSLDKRRKLEDLIEEFGFGYGGDTSF